LGRFIADQIDDASVPVTLELSHDFADCVIGEVSGDLTTSDFPSGGYPMRLLDDADLAITTYRADPDELESRPCAKIS
jgi:hypothetical protein